MFLDTYVSTFIKQNSVKLRLKNFLYNGPLDSVTYATLDGCNSISILSLDHLGIATSIRCLSYQRAEVFWPNKKSYVFLFHFRFIIFSFNSFTDWGLTLCFLFHKCQFSLLVFIALSVKLHCFSAHYQSLPVPIYY